MKKHIPNIITLINLCCGIMGVILASYGFLIEASFMAFLGMFFDFFDGLVARLLKVHSKLGVQLDSLADMVTFGLIPGIVMLQLINRSFGFENIIASPVNEHNFLSLISINPYSLVGLLISVSSCYRLAYFNIDKKQQYGFIGLPTPANALLILSIPLILHFQSGELWQQLFLNSWFLIGLSVLSSYLLNSNIPLFGLKFESWSLAKNKIRYGFICFTIIAFAGFQFVAIPWIILVYILLSWLENYTHVKK